MKLLEAGPKHSVSCVTLVDFAGILVPSSDIHVLHRCSFFVVDPSSPFPLTPLPCQMRLQLRLHLVSSATVWLHTQPDTGDLQPWFSAYTCTHFVRLRVH